MRKIKFRGMTPCTGEWLYGDLVHDDIGGFYIYPLDSKGLYTENRVVSDTVGQYTGLHDKRRQEIYDGDILFVEFADKSGGHQLVGWNERTASWGIMHALEYQALKEGDDWPEFKNYTLLAFLKKAIICEVVGNIHDKPELLKQNKEKE